MFRSLRSLVAPVILFSLSATLYPGAAFASASFTNWAKTGGSWYYLEPSGDMATGCLKDNSKWYYWSESGAMTIGWKQIGGSWYHFDGAGWMTTGWQKVGSSWYYLDASGVMRTGWQKIDNVWYYFNKFSEGTEGVMRTGWVKVKDVWYFLDESGAMQTGWIKTNGSWYYLKPSGAMATGWIKDDSEWYYLSESGATYKKRPYEVVEEFEAYTTTKKKKAAAQEAAIIAIDNWDDYAGVYKWQEAPELTIHDINSLHVGEAIPSCTLIDGKLIHNNTNWYPLICDNKIIAFMMLQCFDVSNAAGSMVAPTELIREA